MADLSSPPKGIAYIHWGNSWQLRSFQDFSHYMDALIYIHDLPKTDLSAFRAVIMPDAMDSEVPRPYADQLNAYFRSGGFLIVFLQGNADWIDYPGLTWTAGNCRDWLWWTRGGKLEIRLSDPPHPITKHLPLEVMSWHWGGSYCVPPSARPILELQEQEGALFLDIADAQGKGRLLLSTLDPHSHNGQRFMPATTALLQRFYPWLNQELCLKRPPRNRFTYLQCQHQPTEWYPDRIAQSLQANGFQTRFHPLYDLSQAVFEQSDILYLPSSHDEFFLHKNATGFMNYLEQGGSLILCAEPCTAWLPFLSPFQTVPPRPFTNIKVRIRDDRFGIFAPLGPDFDGWQGIFGQYARGWTEPPAGAYWLTDIGPDNDPKPADWIWRYPAKTHRGGFVFMHNGDNMTRYPDHGPQKQQLIPSIARALQDLMQGAKLF